MTEQGISRKRLVEGLRGSLDRLQLEYVDIIIVTRQPDTHIPIEDVVRTCTHLIELGWAFYWGTCKWTPAEIMQAQSVARQFNLIPAAVEQTGFHIFQRERLQQMQEMCVKLSLSDLAVSQPSCNLWVSWHLAIERMLQLNDLKGLQCHPKGHQALLEHILSPKGRMHQTQVRQLCKLASRLHCTCAQLAIAWCLKTPTLSCVLLGAATVDQLQENLEAIQVQTRINFTVQSEIERILSTDSSDGFL
ncbi:Voltage-gated potassium channel subunit beta-2 [Clonorchis sinensis]|uniref:Voltage-gated potassium channel subunit beta-2 n=1 Tax=Clonorchis sinensis TaxID=79923 RepID=A0A8T1MRN0_CLOSI|nr:Voltage-gated potassium channel subunit beta-2 [Clonorchis sinensis]